MIGVQISHILVVDDERAIRLLLSRALTQHGYRVNEVTTGHEAIKSISQSTPDLILLDSNLPDMSGNDVTRYLRKWTQTPIIMLSDDDNEQDKILALDSGADDYVTKPFGIGELMARIRVALRRVLPQNEHIFQVGNLYVDLARRTVKLMDTVIQLTPTEYDILKVFITHRDKVISHEQLLREVRGGAYKDKTHLLRVHMSNLRQKLELNPKNPQLIITEPGIGYRLIANN